MATETDGSLAATLLEEVDSVIRGAIRRKLHVSLRANDSREQNMDGLDLLSEVQLKLLAKLRQSGDAGVGAGEIKEFRAYAATVAYHCCADYLRAKYPQRTSLKNCLRRLLDKTDGYAVWTAVDGELMCGFAGWRGGAYGGDYREGKGVTAESGGSTGGGFAARHSGRAERERLAAAAGGGVRLCRWAGGDGRSAGDCGSADRGGGCSGVRRPAPGRMRMVCQ